MLSEHNIVKPPVNRTVGLMIQSSESINQIQISVHLATILVLI